MSFLRLESSHAKYSAEGLRFLTFMSPALGGRGTASFYLPEGWEAMRDLPLVLVLHGVYGDHWSWAFMGGAHRRAAGMIERGEIPPMALAMPSDGLFGEGSGYVNHPGRACESWIVDDVVGCAREAFPCFAAASPLFVTGFSMGGFGALRLGAKYADRFRGIGAHASATRYEHLARFFAEPRGDESHLREEDRSALHWMRANRAILPPIRFDCGADDILVDHSRELHAQLDAEGIPHAYEELPGRHSWDYAHEHLGDSLKFFGGMLAK